MDVRPPVPETRVLAIASHVTYGYVGNKMVTFVMQALGCDVSAIDTVHFSNHTAYKQFKGRKVPAEEIEQLYEGLRQNGLTDFDMMLTGYAASKEVVRNIGNIAKDLRLKNQSNPGSFFWILDPVMGDEGRLYVAEDIVPEYKALLPHADLIVPNAFEAELLSDSKITDMQSLLAAIETLHKTYKVPNVVVTSLGISPRSGRRKSNTQTEYLKVVGSTCKSDFSPRTFSITVPALPIFFSGTGDMFAALMLVRLREAASKDRKVLHSKSWQPPDDVVSTELPLAKAMEKALASMHAVLVKTKEQRDEALAEENLVDGASEEDERQLHLKRTKESEVRVVRSLAELREPPLTGSVKFAAEAVDLQHSEQGK